MNPLRARALLVAALAWIQPACTVDDEPRSGGALSAAVEEIRDPDPRVTDLDAVEELTETLAYRLNAWADALKQRRFPELGELIAADFVGHDLGSPGEHRVETGPLEIASATWEVAPALVDRDGFLGGLRGFLSPFGTLHGVRIDVAAAEFALGDPLWGALTLRLELLGEQASGGILARRAETRVRCERRQGRWWITRLTLHHLTEQRRAQPLFTDVTRSAGVAAAGPRFPTPGNDSFAWNGAAVHDVNGDGRFDVFTTQPERNYLYLNRGDGGFHETAESAGLAQPAAGTGALFFDADNDGDLDLLLGRTGFVHRGETIGGPCSFFTNAGDGTFRECGAERGFTALHCAFSLAAADVEHDGDLDVYVCSYNAEGYVAADSWHAASNGTPNALYVNDGDGAFEDRAREAGVDDATWSYAAAFADVDRDGDPDLFVANDYGPDRMYVNDGAGRFQDRAPELGVDDVGNGMSAGFADADNDGDLDLYVANMEAASGTRILNRLGLKDEGMDGMVRTLAAGNSLYLWNGRAFERLPRERGAALAGWAWSAQFLDLDLDGDEDLACVNGFVSGDEGAAYRDSTSLYWRQVVASTLPPRVEFVPQQVNPPAYLDHHGRLMFEEGYSFSGHERDKVWLNQDGAWVDVSAVSGVDDANDGRALCVADFDQDGDPDLFVHNSQKERHRLYRNDTGNASGNGWVQVRLKGTDGHASAAGAVVHARFGGRRIAKVMAYGSGFLSQNAPEMIFGLGEASDCEVTVQWPGRAEESFGLLEAGACYLLVEGTGEPQRLERGRH